MILKPVEDTESKVNDNNMCCCPLQPAIESIDKHNQQGEESKSDSDHLLYHEDKVTFPIPAEIQHEGIPSMNMNMQAEPVDSGKKKKNKHKKVKKRDTESLMTESAAVAVDASESASQSLLSDKASVGAIDRGNDGSNDSMIKAENTDNVTTNAINDTETSSCCSNYKVQLPEAFICSIGFEVMKDPVMCAFGHTFERSNIESWLSISNRCPKTNTELPTLVTIPNHGLRAAIEEYFASIKK